MISIASESIQVRVFRVLNEKRPIYGMCRWVSVPKEPSIIAGKRWHLPKTIGQILMTKDFIFKQFHSIAATSAQFVVLAVFVMNRHNYCLSLCHIHWERME